VEGAVLGRPNQSAAISAQPKPLIRRSLNEFPQELFRPEKIHELREWAVRRFAPLVQKSDDTETLQDVNSGPNLEGVEDE
jgi:hypothetical protein